MHIELLVATIRLVNINIAFWQSVIKHKFKKSALRFLENVSALPFITALPPISHQPPYKALLVSMWCLKVSTHVSAQVPVVASPRVSVWLLSLQVSAASPQISLWWLSV